jgi:hypothetical protein
MIDNKVLRLVWLKIKTLPLYSYISKYNNVENVSNTIESLVRNQYQSYLEYKVKNNEPDKNGYLIAGKIFRETGINKSYIVAVLVAVKQLVSVGAIDIKYVNPRFVQKDKEAENILKRSGLEKNDFDINKTIKSILVPLTIVAALGISAYVYRSYSNVRRLI